MDKNKRILSFLISFLMIFSFIVPINAENDEKNIFKEKEKNENKFAKLISKFYKLNLLIILIIIWIILVLIYLIYQSISRKKREESNKNVQ